jgi:hypothetical protein
VHAPFRVATMRVPICDVRNYNQAFPVIYGCFFILRLDGEIGTYLALMSG